MNGAVRRHAGERDIAVEFAPFFFQLGRDFPHRAAVEESFSFLAG